MKRLLPSLWLTLACQDAALKTTNARPTASITSPSATSEILEGAEFTLTGVVGDADHDPGTLRTTWWVDDVVVCQGEPPDTEGTTTCITTLAADAREVRLEVRDPVNQSATDQVSVQVVANEAPEARISRPLDGAAFEISSQVFLEGTVTDREDPSESLTVRWLSDRDGVVGSGAPDSSGHVSETIQLSAGVHLLALEVTDLLGRIGRDSLTVEIRPADDPPSCSIIEPGSDAVLSAEQSFAATAAVADNETAAPQLQVVWSSDQQGPLGNAAAASDGTSTVSLLGLTPGAHQLTLTVTDDVGQTCSDSVTVYSNATPTVSIVNPPAGQILAAGEPHIIRAVVSDLEDTPDNLTVTITDDQQGPLIVSGVDAQGSVTATLSGEELGPHIVTVEVADSHGARAAGILPIVVDGLPSPPTVQISPGTPTTTDALEAVLVSPSIDPDGDPITYGYAWTRNGQATGQTLPTIDASATQRGDLWTVVVTPADPWFPGEIATANVTISNTPPTSTPPVITPASPTVTDTLACLSASLVDADGDAVTPHIQWFVDGQLTSSSAALLPGQAIRGQSVSCQLTPDDGTARGQTAVSAAVVIGNSRPTLSHVTLSPASPQTDDVVTCSAHGFTDADEDTGRVDYQWRIDGLDAGRGDTLQQPIRADQIIRCEATPHDGLDAGPTVAVQTRVMNTPPTIDGAYIEPDPVVRGDILTCYATGFQDVDGDADQTTFAWTVDGLAVGQGSTLQRPLTRGEVIGCTATPSDGRDTGSPRVVEVTVRNTPPQVVRADILPPTPDVLDDLTCTATGLSDADGDVTTAQFAWYVDESLVGLGDTLLAGTVTQGTTVRCLATPTDGLTEGEPVESTPVTIENTPPHLQGAVISPEPAFAGDVLQCVPVGHQDPDDQQAMAHYRWLRNGQEVGLESWLAVPLSRDDVVACEITPDDGVTTGMPVSVTTVIQNTAPQASVISLTPVSPQTGDTLTCDVLDFSDADGDRDRTTILWDVAGATVGSGATLPVSWPRGTEVTCTATVHDGTDPGPTLTASTTIVNSLPIVAAVDISPLAPTSADNLTCAALGVTDADGDSTSVTLAWEIDGDVTATGTTLDAALTVRGASVRCLATPHDGLETGVTVASAPVLIGNGLPSAVAARLSPLPARTADALTCEIVGFQDPDGDADQTSFSWSVNGSMVGSGPILPAVARRGDEVLCTATPSDGVDQGASWTAATTIINTAPEATRATITPGSPTQQSTLQCFLSDYTDADGDPDQSTITWAIDGAPAGSGPVLLGPFRRDQTITCTIAVHDGLEAGPVVTDEVRIGNAAPVVDSASISPIPLYTETPAIGSSTVSDPDGDTAFARYHWLVDGIDQSETTQRLDPTAFVKGQEIVLLVTPDDGDALGYAEVVGPVVVQNSPPRELGVTILPSDPLNYTELRCVVSQPAFDPDGDPVTYTVEWTSPLSQTPTTTTTWPDDTIPGEVVSQGTWSCTVTPADVEGLVGSPASATVDVRGLWPDQEVMLADADIQIFGQDLSDHLGDGPCAIATPDIDGDGLADLVLGVRELNLAPGNDTGGVRVFFGAGLVSGLLMPLSDADAFIDGDQGAAQLGQCVTNAGDLDGDGRDELLVGQPRFDSGTNNIGRAMLFRGSSLTQGASLTPEDAWRTWSGTVAQEMAGESLAGDRDLDGGGLPDLIIGAPQNRLDETGRVYILRGEALPDSGPLPDRAYWTIRSDAQGDRLGEQVKLGDISGDGLADLVASAPKRNASALLGGAVFVFDAMELPPTGGNLGLVDARWEIVGTSPSDNIGTSLALGDIDGDGRQDIFVGSPNTDLAYTDAGAGTVHAAQALPPSGIVEDRQATMQVLGLAVGDVTGQDVHPVPDMDYDGRPELLIGSPERDLPDASAGEVGLYTSRRLALVGIHDTSSADHIFRGEDRYDRAGKAVHGADFDGDGRGDIIIGAPYEDAFWPTAGSIYIFFAP